MIVGGVLSFNAHQYTHCAVFGFRYLLPHCAIELRDKNLGRFVKIELDHGAENMFFCSLVRYSSVTKLKYENIS